MSTDRENGKDDNVDKLDATKVANYLKLARDNHDWGDVDELISQLRGEQSFGIDVYMQTEVL